MNNVFVGRQPILDKKLDIFAYELLFRSGDGVRGNIDDGDRATASVLLHTLTEFGLDRVVQGKRAFVNITRNLLVGEEINCLPPNRIVLEILEDVEPDAEVLEAVKRLKRHGFTIALDDYVYRHELEPLVSLADIVKIDLPNIPRDELASHLRGLRRHPVKILAEKVETQEDFEICKELGCDFFQGYFFCKPQTLSRAKIDSNPAAIVRLLSTLQDPRVTSRQIEELLRMDANLCYKILRFANSAQTSYMEKIESIRHAVTLMGIARIRSMATMMLMAGLGHNKPQELLNIAMIRAKMCELIAEHLQERQPDRMFTVGVLSAFDALLDTPMEEVVQMLHLSAELSDALLHRTGIVGNILTCVLNYEQGNWPIECPLGIEAEAIVECYLSAVSWASSCFEGVHEPARAGR